MQMSIKATGIELTPAIRDYAEKKIGSLVKYFSTLDKGAVEARIEVGKTTNHHQSGDIFRSEVNLTMPKRLLRAEKETSDLYASIDFVHDELKRQILSFKDKFVKEKVRLARKTKMKE